MEKEWQETMQIHASDLEFFQHKDMFKCLGEPEAMLECLDNGFYPFSRNEQEDDPFSAMARMDNKDGQHEKVLKTFIRFDEDEVYLPVNNEYMVDDGLTCIQTSINLLPGIGLEKKNVRISCRTNLLGLACKSGNRGLGAFLIAKGSLPNHRCYGSRTLVDNIAAIPPDDYQNGMACHLSCLHLAVRNRHPAMVKLLLEAGVDVSETSFAHMNAADFAVRMIGVPGPMLAWDVLHRRIIDPVATGKMKPDGRLISEHLKSFILIARLLLAHGHVPDMPGRVFGKPSFSFKQLLERKMQVLIDIPEARPFLSEMHKLIQTS